MYSKETESEATTRYIILANKKEEGHCKSNSPGFELRSTIKQKGMYKKITSCGSVRHK
jgi:hypothetical protein